MKLAAIASAFALVAAFAPSARADVANADNQVVCIPKDTYEKTFEPQFPAATKYVYDSWLDAQFKRKGSVCLYLTGDKGIEHADRKPKVGDEFIAAVRKFPIIAFPNPKQTKRWSCLLFADHHKFFADHRDAEYFASENKFSSIMVVDDHTCYAMDVVALFEADVGKDVLAELENHILDQKVLDAQRVKDAMRWEKIKVDTYKLTKKLPRPGKLHKKLGKALLQSAIGWWAGSDIGNRARVRDCVVTSSGYTSWDSGDGHEGRSVYGACGVEVEPNVCVVYHDGARQDYVGDRMYGGFYYQAYDYELANRIDCKKLKK